MSQVLSTRTLNRTLLARQLLLERAAMPVLDAIEHLVGMQAQVPANPYVGLWSRLAGFEPGALSALIEERRAVRIVVMRATIHLVSGDDALFLRPAMQPVLDRELFANRTWARGLEGVDLEPALALARELVEERPQTVAELRAAFRGRWPDANLASLAYAARNLVPMVQVPPRGLWNRSGRPAMTTLEHWLGRPPAADASPDRVLLRYLRAFGPATVGDAGAWSRLTGLREAFERLRPALRTFRDERGRELFDVPDGEIADPDLPAPVRFLPEYDNAMLAHQDRRRIVPEAVWPRIRDRVDGRTGVAAFLVDGVAAGLWWTERERGRTTLLVEPFAELRGGTRAEVEDEAGRLLALLGADAAGRDVRLLPSAS